MAHTAQTLATDLAEKLTQGARALAATNSTAEIRELAAAAAAVAPALTAMLRLARADAEE
jgi:hypothetical protein